MGGTERTRDELLRGFGQFRWTQFIPAFGVRHDAAARRAIVGSITARRADIVFLAIGRPQSEVVCAEVVAAGGARGVALCIGASLEFATGEKTRAPGLVRRMKLEWLYRLLSGPRRL